MFVPTDINSAESLAEYLRSERITRNWSIRHAADRLNVHRNTLYNLESEGRSTSSALILAKIHLVYGDSFAAVLRLALKPYAAELKAVKSNG